MEEGPPGAHTGPPRAPRGGAAPPAPPIGPPSAAQTRVFPSQEAGLLCLRGEGSQTKSCYFRKGYFYRTISGFLQEFQPRNPLAMRFREELTHIHWATEEPISTPHFPGGGAPSSSTSQIPKPSTGPIVPTPLSPCFLPDSGVSRMQRSQGRGRGHTHTQTEDQETSSE